MATRPSDTPALKHVIKNVFWEAIETHFDNGVGTASLPRNSAEKLSHGYITQRRFDDFQDVQVLRSRLPTQLQGARVGPTEIELIDFLLNYKSERVLNIEGPRGSGKTSLLHYVEHTIKSSGYQDWPVLFIVNCLSGQEQVELDESEISRLLAEELLAPSPKLPTDAIELIRKAACDILEQPSFGVARTAFVHLKSSLGPNFGRLVLAFDNLDQHPPATVIRCIELTRQLHAATGISCLVTLRPGCLHGVQLRGGARAFFRFRMNVSAPKIGRWLASIGQRVAADVEASHEAGQPYRVIDQQVVTPTLVKSAFAKLDVLLSTRLRDQDSAVGILESMASDDVRHVVLLVRNLLSHRDLPVAWLLSNDPVPPEYHPIPAILEGDQKTFSGRLAVPNLLCRDATNGDHDYLISYRILTLLNSGVHAVSFKNLLHQLELLGHSGNVVVEAIRVLHDAVLIRSTTSEQIGRHSPMPEHFLITEAGQYCLHKLISYTDYLITVIPNVPLRHEAFQQGSSASSFSFVDRLSSSRELVLLVRSLEEWQVARLRTRSETADLAILADTLANGGLLTDALVAALVSARVRGAGSRSLSVQREVDELESLIGESQEWITAQRAVLREISERARDRRAPRIPDVHLAGLDTQVVVKRKVEQYGTLMKTVVEVRCSSEVDFALIALTGVRKVSPVTTAALAVRSDEKKGVLQAYLLHEADDLRDLIQEIKVQAVIGGLGAAGRIGLLTTSDVGGSKIRLRLQLLKADGVGTERMELGRSLDIQDITSDVEDIKKSVEFALEDPLCFEDEFRVQGTRLSKLLMDPEGENKFASYFKLIETLVILMSKEATSIPWEWIRPAPTRSDPNPPSLGECFEVVRWPAERMEDAVEAMAQLSLVAAAQRVGKIVTAGLDTSIETPWRCAPTHRVRELFERTRGCDTFHLVGHVPRDVQFFHVLGDGPRLTEHGLRATLVHAPQVVLSGCEAGASRYSTNLAIEMSLASGCAVWAPLVRIRRSDAEQLDVDLARSVEADPDSTVAGFFRERRKRIDALASVYARYGLRKKG